MATTCQRIVRCLATTIACMVGTGAHAFNLELAQDRSSRLNQTQMDQAWDLIEAAIPLATAGRHADALSKLRQGLAIHPAEAGAHLLAAQLAETISQWPQAATHWQAVLSFAPSSSDEQRKAERALRIILPRLEGGAADLVTCSVLGIPMLARQSQCDPGVARIPPVAYAEDLFAGLRLQAAIGPKARVKDPKMEFKACIDAWGMSLFSWLAVLNHSGTEEGPFVPEQVPAWLYPHAVAIGSDEIVANRHLQAAREGRCHFILDTPQCLQQIASKLPAGWKLSTRPMNWGDMFGVALKRSNFVSNTQRMALVGLGGDFAHGWYQLGRASVTTKLKFDAMAQEIQAKGFSKEVSSRVMDVYGRVVSGEISFNQGKKDVRYFGSQQEAEELTVDAVRHYLITQLR